MNIIKENIDAVNAVVKLQISETDYLPRIEKTLNEHRKKMVIKGFRPGKAPLSLVQKMYGTAVKIEEVDKLVSESLSNFLTDEKLSILGQPLPSSTQQPIDLESDKDMEFSFDIAIAPEFEAELNKKVQIPYYTIAVDNDLIERQIENYKNRYGKSAQSELIEEKSYIKVDLEQVDAEGKTVENGIVTHGTFLAVDLIQDEDIKKSFLGLKKDDKFVVDIKKAYVNETEIAGLLRINKDQVAEMNPMFQMTINSIETFTPAELGTELYDKVFGQGICTTEEEFRTKVVEEIRNIYVEDSEYRFAIDAKDVLIKKYGLTLPDAFLKRWLKATDKENKLTDEVIEKEYPLFSKDLHWQLIKEKIAKIADFKIENEEVLEQAKKDTVAQFRQYGLPIGQLTDEQLASFAQKNLERKEDYQKTAEKVLDNKVLAYIKEHTKSVEKEISVEEFKKLYENLN